MKNKRIALLLAAVLLFAAILLVSCSEQNTSGQNAGENSPVANASIEPGEIPMAEPSAQSTSAVESQASAQAGGLTAFTATDLDGNTVTQDIFADYSLTMVNIWATFCSPCIEEMPYLGQLKSEYQNKGVNIVGIVADVQNSDGSIPEEGVAFAKEIVSQTGANYTHLLPSESLNNIILNNVAAVPTTVFVDSKGNRVGEEYVGSRDKQEWAEIIEELLK